MIRRAFRLYRDAFSGLGRDVWLVSFVLLVNRAGTMVLPFISLYLTEERSFSIATAGRLLALYGVGAIGGGYLGGWLCDRVGSQRAQQLSLIASGVMFLAFVWLESLAAISVAVLLLAVVAEAYRPAAMAAVGERAPKEVQGRAFALLRLAANIGMGIGPAAGGWLATYNYTSLFIVDAVSCWLATIPLFLLPAVVPARSEADRGDGAAAPRSPWRDRPFLLLMLLVVAMAAVIFQIFSTLPLYFRHVYGLPPSSIGMLLALNAGLIVIFEMILIYRVERFARMRTIALGALLLCAGFGLMPFGASIPFAAFTIAVWTFGEMLSLPLLNVAVAARAPAEQRGRYMGVYTMAFATAFVFAPAAGTYTFERFGPDVLWYAIGAVGPLLWFGARLLGRHFNQPTAQA